MSFLNSHFYYDIVTNIILDSYKNIFLTLLATTPPLARRRPAPAVVFAWRSERGGYVDFPYAVIFPIYFSIFLQNSSDYIIFVKLVSRLDNFLATKCFT